MFVNFIVTDALACSCRMLDVPLFCFITKHKGRTNYFIKVIRCLH
jgi:hypothetical protein